MKNFHLIGQSIQTSLSPLIHNFLFKLKGLQQYKYSIYPKQNHLLTLKDLDKQNISGISITIPFKQSFKEEILNGSLGTVASQNYTKQKSQKQKSKKTAQEILVNRSIINTIRKNTLKKISTKSSYDCFNTDIFGIKQCIKKNQLFSLFLNKNKLTKSNLSSTKAIIIGGGATAQTFMSYFEQNQIKMIVINRSVQKIQKLSTDGYNSNIQKVFSFQADKLIAEIEAQQNFQNLIVINTLPTSIMRQNILQNTDNSLKKLLQLRKLQNIFYMDVNYRDSEESLLKIIESFTNNSPNIHKLSTGLDMLVWQGILQNYLFCEQDQNTNNFDQKQFDQQFIKIMSKLREQGKA